MQQALCPVMRQVITTSAVALLVVAGPIAPGFDTHYGALKSAMAAPGSGSGTTGSGATSGGTGAAGTGASGGTGAAGTATLAEPALPVPPTPGPPTASRVALQ